MTDEGTQTGLTDYELVALVDLNPTPQGLRALEAIGVAGLLADPGAVRAGVASLLVRDLADADEDRLLVHGFAGDVGTMLTSASDLLLLVLSRDGRVDGRTVLVDAPAGGLLLDMTRYGAHVVQPLRPGTDLLTLVRDVIAEFAADEGALPFEVALTRFPLDAAERTAGVTVTGPEFAPAWSQARNALGLSDAEAAAAPRRALDRRG